MNRSTQSAYDRGFITKIEIKDKDGRVKGTQEVITYKGLLSLAHEDGLKRVATTLIQVPGPENEMTAIISAQVETGKGVFCAIGDASPDNVNPRIRKAIIRMAETRAKARAFRDAVNIGVVSLEELGQEEADVGERASSTGASRSPDEDAGISSQDLPMTDGQRRYIFRLLSEQGVASDKMADYLRELLGVESLKELNRKHASAVIAYLTNESHELTVISGAR